MNADVDFYFNKPKKWQQELKQLRMTCLDSGLKEELKWGCPCYTKDGRNIVLIHDFKDYCALLFFKGALLKDSEKVLIQQTENVQAARQIRFTGIDQMIELELTIKNYIKQAIEVEKAGLKVPLKKASEFTLPNEFDEKVKTTPKLKAAFEALTPGRQRAYSLYFSSPKQSKTREARIEKCIPQILEGKGLND